MTETFGQRVRRLRDEKGLTVNALAQSVGATEATIRHLELGQSKTPLMVLGLKLADELGVDPYYLAFGDGASVTDQLYMLARRLEAVENRVSRIEGSR